MKTIITRYTLLDGTVYDVPQGPWPKTVPPLVELEVKVKRLADGNYPYKFTSFYLTEADAIAKGIYAQDARKCSSPAVETLLGEILENPNVAFNG